MYEDIAEASAETRKGRGPGSLDFELAAELGLLETLEAIRAKIDTEAPPPAMRKVNLAAAGTGESQGNPVDWSGFPALSLAVWNETADHVYLGAGSGTGTVDRSLVVVGSKSLVVLPLADTVYSFGMDAAALGGGLVKSVLAFRFAEALPPARYALP